MNATGQGSGTPRISFFASLQVAQAVKQIGVFTFPFRINAYRNEVFNMERPSAGIPLFTMKAVHAAESEFVAQPIPKAAVIRCNLRDHAVERVARLDTQILSSDVLVLRRSRRKQSILKLIEHMGRTWRHPFNVIVGVFL